MLKDWLFEKRIIGATWLYIFLGGRDIQEAMGYSMALVAWVEDNLPPHEIQAIMDGYCEKYGLYAEMDWPMASQKDK